MSYIIQLRSGDKFKLGTLNLQIEFERALLPEHIPEPRTSVVDLEDTDSMDQDDLPTKTPPADPTKIPQKTTVSPEAIVGLAATSAIIGNEESQDWTSANLQRDILGCIRNESRHVPQKSPSINSSRQRLDKSLSRSLEMGNEESDIVQGLETRIKAEETQNSNLRDAEVLLGSASKSQQMRSSPSVRNCSERLATPGTDREDDIDDDILQDSIRSTIRCDTPAVKLSVITKATTITSPGLGHAPADIAQPAPSTLGEPSLIENEVTPAKAASSRPRKRQKQFTESTTIKSPRTDSSQTANFHSAAPAVQTNVITSATVEKEMTPVKATLSRPRKRQKQSQIVTPNLDHTTRLTQDSIEPSPSVSRFSGKKSISTPMSQTLKPASHKVLFSSSTTIDGNKSYLNFLKKQGVEKVDHVNDCTILCVGKDTELKRTSKLVLAIALGKDVISDAWIISSYHQKRLLDPFDYFAKDGIREMEWGTSLKEAVERGRKGLKPFANWHFNFTTTIKKDLGSGFAEIKSIAENAGAVEVLGAPPKLGPEKLPKTIVIASQNDDKHLPALQYAGWRVFTKDIITLSVIRGALDIQSDEFLISASIESQASSKKRKR